MKKIDIADVSETIKAESGMHTAASKDDNKWNFMKGKEGTTDEQEWSNR